MSRADQQVALRSELGAVYLDPIHNPPGIQRGWVPEAHASQSCERAEAGRTSRKVSAAEHDPDGYPWCYACTTDDPQRATVRRRPDGSWGPAR